MDPSADKSTLYWKRKLPSDNAWHPAPGGSSNKQVNNMPLWIHRLDVEAACVDIAPFVAGAGALAHTSQLNKFGFTAPASIFHNQLTMAAMHRSAMFLTPLILAFQVAGIQYRYFIPRWASARERRRDEDQARRHVDGGIAVGVGVMLLRTAMKTGPRWSLLDAILGGAIADLALREYYKAHDL